MGKNISKNKIAEWARGMVDIFENGKNIMEEINDLLESLELENNDTENHWWQK